MPQNIVRRISCAILSARSARGVQVHAIRRNREYRRNGETYAYKVTLPRHLCFSRMHTGIPFWRPRGVFVFHTTARAETAPGQRCSDGATGAAGGGTGWPTGGEGDGQRAARVRKRHQCANRPAKRDDKSPDGAFGAARRAQGTTPTLFGTLQLGRRERRLALEIAVGARVSTTI